MYSLSRGRTYHTKSFRHGRLENEVSLLQQEFKAAIAIAKNQSYTFEVQMQELRNEVNSIKTENLNLGKLFP